MIGHHTKIILGIAVLYVCIATVGLWWVSHAISKAGQTLEEYVQVVADTLVQEQTYSELQKLVVATAGEHAQLGSYVLTEADTISFLAEIEALAVQQGVVLTTDSLGVVAQEGTFDALEVAFSIAGDERLVRQMIKILETIPYHSQLQNMQFTRDGTSGTARMHISLLVSLQNV